MSILNRAMILLTMMKPETLMPDDIEKKENLGVIPNKENLQFLLTELTENDHLNKLETLHLAHIP